MYGALKNSGPRWRSFAVLTAVLALVCDAARTGEASPAPPTTRTPVIVAFGDSLTSGPGLQRDQTYPAVLQRKMAAKGYKFRVVNAGVSGNTSARALRRLESVLVPDTRILILALGINDGLRGVPVTTVERNLTTIIERARLRNITVLLCQMEAPPINGFSYSAEFHRLFTRLAARYNLALVPFFLYNVAGDPELNLSDGIHPNAEGHKLIADEIWTHLEPLVRTSLKVP
jgi:acyl-CoA thioesterase I